MKLSKELLFGKYHLWPFLKGGGGYVNLFKTLLCLKQIFKNKFKFPVSLGSPHCELFEDDLKFKSIDA